MAEVTATVLKRRPFGKHWIVSGTVNVTNGANDFMDTSLSNVRTVVAETAFTAFDVGYSPNSNDGTQGTAPGFVTWEHTVVPGDIFFTIIGERDF